MKLLIPSKISKLQIITFLLVVALIASSTYFYLKYKNEQAKNPTRETIETVSAVSKLIELPQNEEPSIATVTEKDKLAEQEFFIDSENGDKVLIYPKASKAILFRPSTNKIINVTSITTNATEDGDLTESDTSDKSKESDLKIESDKTIPETKEVTITLLNGTNTTGITTLAEEYITSQLKGMTIVSRETAQKTNYEETILVDLTGENIQQIESLVTIMNGKIASLPKGEILPESDILIILGSDFITEK